MDTRETVLHLQFKDGSTSTHRFEDGPWLQNSMESLVRASFHAKVPARAVWFSVYRGTPGAQYRSMDLSVPMSPWFFFPGI